MGTSKVLAFVTRWWQGERPRQQTVLVVDDDPMTRHLLTRRLGRDGFAVECADGGRLGMEMARSRSFDLIILDLYMPEYTGLDFLRDARRLEDAPPIIILSAAQNPSVIDHCSALGAVGILRKPVSSSALSTEIKRVMARGMGELAHRR